MIKFQTTIKNNNFWICVEESNINEFKKISLLDFENSKLLYTEHKEFINLQLLLTNSYFDYLFSQYSLLKKNNVGDNEYTVEDNIAGKLLKNQEELNKLSPLQRAYTILMHYDYCVIEFKKKNGEHTQRTVTANKNYMDSILSFEIPKSEDFKIMYSFYKPVISNENKKEYFNFSDDFKNKNFKKCIFDEHFSIQGFNHIL
jgi:hypothetical protein